MVGVKKCSTQSVYQNGAFSLVGIVEIELSLVKGFIELRVADLCHKEPVKSKQNAPKELADYHYESQA